MFNYIFNNCCLCVIFFSCVHMNINLNIIFFCLISRSKVKKCSKNNFYECQEQNVFDFEKYIKTLCICYMYLQASSLNLFGRYMVYVCVYTHSHLSSSSKVSTSSTAGRADASVAPYSMSFSYPCHSLSGSPCLPCAATSC